MVASETQSCRFPCSQRRYSLPNVEWQSNMLNRAEKVKGKIWQIPFI